MAEHNPLHDLMLARTIISSSTWGDADKQKVREALDRVEMAYLQRGNPIPMMLFCPKCGEQHIDAPSEGWDNPPHRSHLCHACGCVWRHADIPTTGVKEIQTKGSADTCTNDKPIVMWPIATDGPYPPGDQRRWLARQLMDSKLTDAEAFGIVRHHPDIDDLATGQKSALEACKAQFLSYAEQHRLKGTPEGEEKARTNVHMAEVCAKAIGERR